MKTEIQLHSTIHLIYTFLYENARSKPWQGTQTILLVLFYTFFFKFIIVFAVVTEFVMFQFWKTLQYLKNIAGFCCHITTNFHQSHKILVLISAI